MEYNPQKIEKKWQKAWEKQNLSKAEDFSKKEKFFLLIEFPYPSGAGLHVGHCRSYSAMDVIARKKRMEGFNVLYSIGWDAFGLPTENYAIKTGIHPETATKKNISNFKRQLKSMGLSFDWDREVNTTDPKYYKWTQWIFLKLFENGLAYQAEIPINWCPSCKIGLANEEVIQGKCERCKTNVEQKKVKQWMLKITKYADRLIKGLDNVNYLEKIKRQQIDWIGKSSGTEIDFRIEGMVNIVKVFTTRVDTLFGVSAIVLAPNHSFVKDITIDSQSKEVKKYIKKSQQKTEFERTKLNKDKTGVFTGSYCVNPINKEKIPIWIGDYVVSNYGGGAVMLVPAHDERDYKFAKEYKLEIKEVIKGGDVSKQAFCDYGTLIDSNQFNGLSSKEAIKKINNWLKEKKHGKKKVEYKLRDWIFSRQHYWGEPIPIIHCKKCGLVPVKQENLPVKLPYIKKYKPTKTGESPLASISKWVNIICPKCGKPAKRETDTMPNWAGSNWYFLRYCDVDNNKELASFNKLEYWMPVDWYNGGMEHTTLHLLYSRFIYKFLYDIKVVPCDEPYKKRTSHGMILAEDGRKMSKSFGNIINPDDIIEKYGADTLRVYEMFMGPFHQAITWNEQGVRGVSRFLKRTWTIISECNKNKSSSRIIKEVNLLNKKIEKDLEEMKFNTAISAFMKFINLVAENKKETGKDVIKRFLVLFSCFAPHICEEAWQMLGNKKSIFLEKWPEYDSNLIKSKRIQLIIQINGKFRDQIQVNVNIKEEEAKEIVLSREKIQNWTKGKKIKRIVFVPKKLINIVL